MRHGHELQGQELAGQRLKCLEKDLLSGIDQEWNLPGNQLDAFRGQRGRQEQARTLVGKGHHSVLTYFGRLRNLDPILKPVGAAEAVLAREENCYFRKINLVGGGEKGRKFKSEIISSLFIYFTMKQERF